MKKTLYPKTTRKNNPNQFMHLTARLPCMRVHLSGQALRLVHSLPQSLANVVRLSLPRFELPP